MFKVGDYVIANGDYYNITNSKCVCEVVGTDDLDIGFIEVKVVEYLDEETRGAAQRPCGTSTFNVNEERFSLYQKYNSISDNDLVTDDDINILFG